MSVLSTDASICASLLCSADLTDANVRPELQEVHILLGICGCLPSSATVLVIAVSLFLSRCLVFSFICEDRTKPVTCYLPNRLVYLELGKYFSLLCNNLHFLGSD